MTLVQLGTFLKIAEAGSFTAAAGLLGYAQSTVTTQIRLLEEELGCTLFERLGKSISLTPEGNRLRGYAEKALQIEREIRLEVPDPEEQAGVIRLGVSESLCYNRLPSCLMAHRRRYPRMEIRISFITRDEFPVLLKQGTLDVVCTLNPAVSGPGLKLLGRRRETLGFFAVPDHPLAGREAVTEKDLADVPLLLTSHGCSFRQMLLEDLARCGVTPRVALETSSKEILKQFAANGFGVAFMPDMAARAEVRDGLLRKLDWQGFDFPVWSQVFVHKDKHVSRAIGALAAMLSGTEGTPEN